MRQAVQRRFGTEQAPAPVQWLSDNGSPYTALATTIVAEQRGLAPITTPAASPESNDMAESFVRTLGRDYLTEADLRSAAVVLAKVPGGITDYNTVRPHSALGYLSPSVYRARCGEKAKVSLRESLSVSPNGRHSEVSPAPPELPGDPRRSAEDTRLHYRGHFRPRLPPGAGPASFAKSRSGPRHHRQGPRDPTPPEMPR